uniref:C-type lectin domain-containing protein n=1 Tax=Amphilophus citrinellus TaxID=61819 RepID=A0A3Q0RZL8_AMPCI
VVIWSLFMKLKFSRRFATLLVQKYKEKEKSEQFHSILDCSFCSDTCKLLYMGVFTIFILVPYPCMFPENCFKITNIFVLSVGEVCRPAWIRFNSKCYYVSEHGQTKSWESSRRDCIARGADLVIITTAVELYFVKTVRGRTWIGLSDTQQEGKWKWVDGSDLVHGFWNSREPNSSGDEDCAEIVGSNGEWNDAASLGICQAPRVPSS